MFNENSIIPLLRAEDRVVNFCKNKLSIHVQIIVTIFFSNYICVESIHRNITEESISRPIIPGEKKTTTLKTLNNDYKIS